MDAARPWQPLARSPPTAPSHVAEMLRSLGFPRQVSVENFRKPNFELVAEILTWLVQRFDPHANVPTDIEMESDRVIFIKAVAQFMVRAAHARISPAAASAPLF